MTHEDEFRAALRADPTTDPKQLARAVGLSGRARRRIVRELEIEGVLRSQRRWKGIVAAGVVGLAAFGLWWALGDREDAGGSSLLPTERRPLSAEGAAVERDLYQAIDRRDPARVESAVAQLAAGEEPVRLAALRYLATVGATDHAGSMLALVDDPSDRVRSAAIQLVAALPGAVVDERLGAVLGDAKRPVSERTLAASGLEGRAAERPHEVARQVLPALLDDSIPLREAAARVLTRLMGRSVPVDVKDREAHHAAWRAVVGAGS